ncbi:hypothetical protein [Sneathiella sp.]|uniref:hypothetical protein n=1 Tax=Sneathiella sp. TaxID=1964365 RepID=UPI002FE2ECB1
MKYVPPLDASGTEDAFENPNSNNPKGSQIPAEFFNVVQTEILNAIENAGLEPDDGDLAQLSKAIQKGRAMDIAFMAGVASDGSGRDLAVQEYGRLVLARPIRIDGFYAHAAVAPTGAAVIVDIEKNGASIFGTKPRIAATDNVHTAGTFAGGAAYVDAVAGDVLVFKVTQIGSTIAGQKLTTTIRASGI